jgi:hypothetical protein
MSAGMFVRRPARARVLVRALLLFALATLWSVPAGAYSWMIRHGYGACATCHLDPSGSGILTDYGRVMGELFLRTRYRGEPEDPGPTAQFLWGTAQLPEGLSMGGDLRLLAMRRKREAAEVQRKFIYMQADLEAAVQVESFVFSGTLGYADEGALGAAITRDPAGNWVSRQHWAGLYLDEASSFLVRAGRLNLPFGIRIHEHTMWVRSLTRTSINDEQQYGVALAGSLGPLRGELMGIAGNLQLRPDEFRERGYSGYLEAALGSRFAIGASSFATHRDVDPRILRETWRQAHGAFLRWSAPWEPLLLLSEWDYVMTSPKQDQWREGAVGYVQGDIQAAPGVHFIVTGELQNVGIDNPPLSWGAWLSYAWFFAPHADLRLDNIYQSLGSVAGRSSEYTFLVQAHLYL